MYYQCSESLNIPYASGSANSLICMTDPDPNLGGKVIPDPAQSFLAIFESVEINILSTQVGRQSLFF
jgi:hypothetical protein